jgi:hypothetical protein
MKNIFVFLIFILPIIVFAQNENLKHDYIWLTGYSSNPTQLEFGGTVIDFNQNPIEIYYEFRDMDFDIASVGMCDAEGEVIFSSNNHYIANRLNEPMENGEGLNSGTGTSQDRVIQAILGLPSPNSDSTYIILHQKSSFAEDLDGNIIGIFSLNKTVVDMKVDINPQIGDLGKVIEKNTLVVEDTLAYGRLTATRHANGRDWWILQQKYGTNKFYRLLLNPEGLIELESQMIGDVPLHNIHGIGQAVFSPDGSKYITSNNYNTSLDAHIDFYSFDRCTGLLSDYERIILNPAIAPNGVSISSNSQFGYFIYSGDYYQINLNETPKELSLIQEYDDTLSGAFIGQLAPDGKIYFSGAASLPEMHVIHNPDEEGIACGIEQHGLELPTFNSLTIPNHPNYRLGRLIGSPCDTLTWIEDTTSVVSTPLHPQSLDVYPNPSSSKINFVVAEIAAFKMTDYLGRIVKEGSVKIGNNSIDVSDFISGVYFLTLEGDVPMIARFVVQKE